VVVPDGAGAWVAGYSGSSFVLATGARVDVGQHGATFVLKL